MTATGDKVKAAKLERIASRAKAVLRRRNLDDKQWKKKLAK